MQYDYRPYNERKVSTQYRSLLEEIVKNGENNPSRMVDGNTGEPLFTREVHGAIFKFNILEDGAPIITERDISGFYKGAIGEIFAL